MMPTTMPTTLKRPLTLPKPVVAACLLALTGAAQAACSSAYNPVSEGLSRTYQGTAGGKVMTYTETITKVTPSSYVYSNSMMPSASSVVKCSGAGTVNTAQNVPGMKVTATRGVTYPAKMTVGTTWNTGISMKGEVQGQTMASEMDTVSKVVGREKVKVKAGTFDALKVQINMTMSMLMNGKMVKQPPMTSYAWLAEGVGLVKSTASGTVIELVKYKK